MDCDRIQTISSLKIRRSLVLGLTVCKVKEFSENLDYEGSMYCEVSCLVFFFQYVILVSIVLVAEAVCVILMLIFWQDVSFT